MGSLLSCLMKSAVQSEHSGRKHRHRHKRRRHRSHSNNCAHDQAQDTPLDMLILAATEFIKMEIQKAKPQQGQTGYDEYVPGAPHSVKNGRSPPRNAGNPYNENMRFPVHDDLPNAFQEPNPNITAAAAYNSDPEKYFQHGTGGRDVPQFPPGHDRRARRKDRAPQHPEPWPPFEQERPPNFRPPSRDMYGSQGSGRGRSRVRQWGANCDQDGGADRGPPFENPPQ